MNDTKKENKQDRDMEQNRGQERSENAGNFANDPERAREAGRKGGSAS